MNIEVSSSEFRYILKPAGGFRVPADGSGPNIQGMTMIPVALHPESADRSTILMSGHDLAPGVRIVSANLQMSRGPGEMSVDSHIENPVVIGGQRCPVTEYWVPVPITGDEGPIHAKVGDQSVILEPPYYPVDTEFEQPDLFTLVVGGNGEVGGALIKTRGGTIFSHATIIRPGVQHESKGTGSVLAIKTAQFSTL